MNWKKALCTAVGGLLVASASATAQIVVFETTPPGVASNDPNVVPAILARGPGLTAASAGDGFNSSGWTLSSSLDSSIAADDYLTFGFTVNGGFRADLSTINLGVRRSGTGPLTISILSSVGGFASSAAVLDTEAIANNTNNQNISFDVSSLQDVTGTVEFRIYGYGGSNTGGTLRVLNVSTAGGLVINGTIENGTGVLTGACCSFDGTCEFVANEAACTDGRAFRGGGSVCSPNPCPLPPIVGACCTSGICAATLTEADCITGGGVWGGAGSACPGFDCSAAPASCCLTDGTCQVLSPTACSAQGGQPGPDATCGPETCPPVGACCSADFASCTLVFGDACRANGGTFLGRGVACSPNGCQPATGANLVTRFDFDANGVRPGSRNLTFTRSANPPFPVADWFGEAQRFVDDLPFALVDDSATVFPGDTQGIAREDKVDSFFGVVDLLDVVSPTGMATATWTFDISGFSGLAIAIDIAAMGDFEGVNCSVAPNCFVDSYVFTAQIDGGAAVELFNAGTNDDGDLAYTLASGTVTTLPDPLTINGTFLTNLFQNFSANLPGTGSTLTLTFTAQTDGGEEAFAFDNIVITGTPGGGGNGSCCLANGSCSVTSAGACIGGDFTAGGVCDPNPCGSDCPADFNDSGNVDVADIFSFLSAWFASAPGSDFNGSGATDVSDIFAFLSAWFAGCP